MTKLMVVNETSRVDFEIPVELLRLLNYMYKHFSIGILKFKWKKKEPVILKRITCSTSEGSRIFELKFFLQVKYMNNHYSIRNELLKPDELERDQESYIGMLNFLPFVEFTIHM